nr:MAG TPA: hypothetical protein [Caudoviricetes sp.]
MQETIFFPIFRTVKAPRRRAANPRREEAIC